MRGSSETAFLQRLALAASSTLDPEGLVRLVISETTEAMGTDVCSVYLLDPDGEHLVLSATNGLSQAGVGRVRLALGEGVTGWAALERRPVVVPDVRAEPRFRWLAGVDQARFVSMCSVPILSGDRLVGVVNVQTDARREFGEGDVGLLAAIAAQVAGVLERSELQARLERRLLELRRSEEIHRRLSELVLAGAGLGAICAAIARAAGAPVAVYDPDGERLAASAPELLPFRLAGFVDPERREDDLTVVPVRAGREPLGWLAVRPDEGGEASERRQAIEHGVTVVALDLVRERAAAEAERRLRGDLLGELLGGRLDPAEAERIADRAARLGYRLREPVWAVVMEPDDDAPDAAGGLRRTRAARAVTDLVAGRAPGGLVVERGESLVLLAPCPDGLPAADRLARDAVRQAAVATGGTSFSCGIGSEAAGPLGLHRVFDEARQALRLARRSGERGAVAAYGRLGVERLLLEIERPERLRAYVEEWLGPLERHGRGQAAAPLLETLGALVDEGWNMRAAARRLHVHVNTLLYRAGRIEELTGRRLDDAEVRLGLALALRARAIAGPSCGPHEPQPGKPRTDAPYEARRPAPSLGLVAGPSTR
jgi:sugar diacid utilization regulator/putative methionine-R-sulfoxide reductase with GAF domain